MGVLANTIEPDGGHHFKSAKETLRYLGEIEDWQEKFLQGAENALRSRPKDEDALKDKQIKKLKQKVGELVLDVDILREAVNGRPFAPKTSDE